MPAETHVGRGSASPDEVLALVREVRLRRALQRLLVKLLARWRKHHAEDHLP